MGAGTKLDRMLKLMEKLVNGHELYIEDELLQDEILGEEPSLKNSREKAMRRYLYAIEDYFPERLIKEKKIINNKRVTVYRTKAKEDIAKVLKFFLLNKDDMTWIIQMLNEQDPSLLANDMEEDVVKTLHQELERDKDVFLFKSKPFEIFKEESQKKVFKDLKKAVLNRECRDIYYKTIREGIERNAKCLKLIYAEHNWYIAIEKEDEKLMIKRIAFIKRTSLPRSKKLNYPIKTLDKYSDYFNYFQNPMTVANKKREVVRLKAYGNYAKYFDQNMKKYFPSQKFIKKDKDGNVEFSIEYTQSAEILPFIQRWLPRVQILSPNKLKKKLIKNLEKSLQILNDDI